MNARAVYCRRVTTDARAESWGEKKMPLVQSVRCSSCNGTVELWCQGLSGMVMYATYNEFFCPHCRKQNHARTLGHILSAHPPMSV